MKRPALILLSIALLALLSFPASADKKPTSKASLQKEIDLLNSQLKANAKDRDKAQQNLNLIQRKITKRKALIEESDREIHSLGDSIRTCEKKPESRYDAFRLLCYKNLST